MMRVAANLLEHPAQYLDCAGVVLNMHAFSELDLQIT